MGRLTCVSAGDKSRHALGCAPTTNTRCPSTGQSIDEAAAFVNDKWICAMVRCLQSDKPISCPERSATVTVPDGAFVQAVRLNAQQSHDCHSARTDSRRGVGPEPCACACVCWVGARNS
jgi:hypothetical protein